MISSGSPTLAQMEHALARVVGARGVAAMLARSRQLSSQGAAEEAALRDVSANLLGASLVNRLLSQPDTGQG
jgi:hypothetical protein